MEGECGGAAGGEDAGARECVMCFCVVHEVWFFALFSSSRNRDDLLYVSYIYTYITRPSQMIPRMRNRPEVLQTPV